jgi:hypothetical protein
MSPLHPASGEIRSARQAWGSGRGQRQSPLFSCAWRLGLFDSQNTLSRIDKFLVLFGRLLL